MPEIMKERPPYVVFETRPEEDRQASIEAGCYKAKDVDYALITPAGSKDRVERVVGDWFEYLTVQVDQGRFPAEWLDGFKHKYKLWKEGQELPVNGTPIKTWAALSPSQAKTLLDLHVLTLEDLAAANEELLSRIGMGARALQAQARDWLASAKDIGAVSAQLTVLTEALDAANARMKSLEAQNTALQAQIAQPARARAAA